MLEAEITRAAQAEGKGFEKVFAFLRARLLAGILKPGDRLVPERELAAQLGVSRPILREALRALTMLGIVEIKDRATGDAARAFLPVLDDLDRAEAHGDLAEGGPLTAIAQKLRGAVAKLGIEPYGEKGELFDPHQHDAIFQRESADVQKPTVSDVVERGYRIGDTVLRVAKVVVDTPAGA